MEKVKIIETDGTELIAVKRKDVTLNSEQGREMALADNATAAADLEWDKEAIGEVFKPEDVKEWDVDLDWDSDTEVEEDEAPEVNEKEPAKSELGKVYQLGNHRLMCGDSTDAGSVAILMDGQKADMVFTDPPYNMNYVGGGFLESHCSMTRKEVKDIIDFEPDNISWLTKIKDMNVFIFTSKDLVPKYMELFKDWKFNILVWAKTGTPPFINNNYYSDLEYLLYFHKGKRVWNNGLTPDTIYKKFYISNILQGKKDAGEDLHPTMKPIDFISNEIRVCSNKNGIVIDLFGGSGSTLIACEQLGRKCYMMELDPKYCDVIRRRYWKFTHDGDETGWEEGTPAI